MANLDGKRCATYIQVIVVPFISALLLLALSACSVTGPWTAPSTSKTSQGTQSPSSTGTLSPGATETYSAPVPGPGSACDDTHGGLWETSTVGSTTVQCSSAGMTLIYTKPSNTDSRAEVYFSWPEHPFGTRYSIQADISGFGTSSCAGMTTHRDSDPAARPRGYYFKICNDSALSVTLGRIDDNGSVTVTEIYSGSLKKFGIAAAAQYHLGVIVDGADQEFIVNGKSIKSFDDETYGLTNKISFFVNGASVAGAQSTVTFSNFTSMITPTTAQTAVCSPVHWETGEGVTAPIPTQYRQVANGCVAIVFAFSGNINGDSWTDGALIAFPPGTYTGYISDGEYNIRSAAQGPQFFCSIYNQGHTLKRVSPLSGWPSC